MTLLDSLFNQMIFLFIFIVIGFILAKGNFVSESAANVISKLENTVFIPGLILSTFIQSCSAAKLISAWDILLSGLVTVIVLVPVSLLVAKFCSKDICLRNIIVYGLVFPNFGYMGNAIISAVFPDSFFEYTVFTMAFWPLIYLWGVPALLIPGEAGEHPSLSSRLKSFLNPMMIAMVLGLVLGLTGWGMKLPTSVLSVINVSGNCMSPLAMILTGITMGRSDVLGILKKWRIYMVCAIRLLAYPLVTFGILIALKELGFFIPMVFRCAVCMAALPMGLNGIVIPTAYGKDTSDAAGMVLVSHLLSIITIPLIFMLVETVL